jgi:hypothetical protein
MHHRTDFGSCADMTDGGLLPAADAWGRPQCVALRDVGLSVA